MNRFQSAKAISWYKARGEKPRYPFTRYKMVTAFVAHKMACKRAVAAVNELNRHLGHWRDLYVTEDARVLVPWEKSKPSSTPEAKPNNS